MLCETFQKPKKKPKRKRKSVPKNVMDIVEQRSKGICEFCHSRKATDPHHICEIGMGGGNRLDIPINILHVCRICHNHDNTKFLQDANEILRQRLQIFDDKKIYKLSEIARDFGTDRTVIERQVIKGFLKTPQGWPSGIDIKRWLGVA